MNSAVVANLKTLLTLDVSDWAKGSTAADANAKKLADRLSKDLAPSQARVNALIRDFAGNTDIRRAMELATAIQQVGGASKLTASEQTRANRTFQEAIEKLKALGGAESEASRHLTAMAADLKKVKAPADQLGAGLDTIIGKAKSLAGLFGVSLTAGALIGFGRQVFEAADQIGDLATKMGVSTDAAQRFQFAAEQSGASIDDVSQSIVKMNDLLAEGDKSTISALDAIGLKFQDIRAMKPEDAFRTIADAIGRIPDPMLQANIAMDMFGKSGASLLPMIKERSLDAAEGAEIMSKETIQSLKEAKQAWENFWRDLRVIAANFLAGDIGQQLKQFLTDLKTGLSFIANFTRASGSPIERGIVAFGVGVGEHINAQKAQRDNDPATRLMREMTDPALMSSHGPKFETRAEREARLKKEEEHAKRIKAIFDSFTGAERRQRIRELDEAFRGLKPENIDDWHKLNEELNALVRTGGKLTPFLETLRRSTTLPVQPTDWATLLGSAIPVGALVGTPPIPSLDLPMPKKPAAKPLTTEDLLRGVTVPGQTFMGSLRDITALVPQTILQALTGGGGVGKSLAGLFGSGIASSLMGKATDGVFQGGFGEKLQKSFLGEKFGGAIANIIPGIGALLGPALSKVFGFIGNIGANTTKRTREDFAKQLGFENLENLHAKLQSLGADGQKLANLSLNVIGKKDQKATEMWMKDVSAFFARLEKVPGKVQELSAALGRFGGAIPKQLDPLLDSILGQSNLSADLRKQLEGMRKPTWQAAAELADAFGVDKGALGQGFNQARVADSFFAVKRALDTFDRLGGGDRNGILAGVADEVSAAVVESQKNRVAIPEAVKDLVLQIDALGLLLDENGNRIDGSLLQFANIEDEYEKQVVSLLEEIRDALTGKAPGSPYVDVPGIQVPGDNPRMPRIIGDEESSRWLQDERTFMPGFAGGTHGQYVDFGPGTPVMLHGKERVMTEAEGQSTGNMTIIVRMDRREVARGVMPYLPGAVREVALSR